MTAPFNQMKDVMTKAPVIPVLTISDVRKAVPLANALTRGGLPVLEITLRTDAALEVIRAIATEVPGAIIGAGTVLTPKQIKNVAKAGGTFCVSPGATPALLEAAEDEGMQLLPGAATASEVMTLLEKDIQYMKFFPAQPAGGVPYLKGISAPLPQAKFCPTGGVNPENAQDYLSLSNVLCVGGSWVCPEEALAHNNWEAIEHIARSTVRSLVSRN